MAIEIVSFPIKNGDFPWFFACLPEGTNIQMEIQPIWGDCGNIGMADPLQQTFILPDQRRNVMTVA